MVNSGAVIEVRDKASGEFFAEAISATLADVDEAAAAAKRAQPAWAELPYTERTAVLRAAAAALTDRAKQFRELIIRETGSIGGKADYEIGAATSELIEAAGLPAGLFGVLPGDVEVGHRLVTHPDITMIHFTGSTKVGRQIAQTAGGLLRKVSLELGGNNALIVLDDADLDQAAMIGAWSSFHYQGQTCITAGRHIVQAQIADEYARRLAARAEVISVGNTFTEDVGLGPMINHTQLTRAVELLAEAVKDGATVLAGGTTDGPFFRPTVVTNVSPSSRLWTEEIFAPIAPILVVQDDEAAVDAANDTDYRLVNSVLTGDPYRGIRVARRLRAGMVHVNDATPQDEAIAPFGGTGQSGLGGRSGSDANLEEFTERRWLTVTDGPAHYPY